jgi:hypothetical protein
VQALDETLWATHISAVSRPLYAALFATFLQSDAAFGPTLEATHGPAHGAADYTAVEPPNEAYGATKWTAHAATHAATHG